MYAEDSFFTLTQTGQIGLLTLSLVLSGALVAVVYWITGTLPRLAGLPLAIVGFWAFDWLSPQIYYFYYITQFDGLPLQNVVRYPPSPQKILQIMTFQDEPTLSAHGRGLLAWALIVTAIWRGRARRHLPD